MTSYRDLVKCMKTPAPHSLRSEYIVVGIHAGFRCHDADDARDLHDFAMHAHAHLPQPELLNFFASPEGTRMTQHEVCSAADKIGDITWVLRQSWTDFAADADAVKSNHTYGRGSNCQRKKSNALVCCES